MLGLYFDELSVGQTAETTHVVGAADIEAFAAVSGDVNPVHMDEAYARTTTFGGRIAHGMLAAAYISAVLGNQLPGPGAIYLSQSLRFRRPVTLRSVRAPGSLAVCPRPRAAPRRAAQPSFRRSCRV